MFFFAQPRSPMLLQLFIVRLRVYYILEEVLLLDAVVFPPEAVFNFNYIINS